MDTENKYFITDERYQEIIDPIKKLAIARNEKYGNSIDIMLDSSIIDLCLMKLFRTREMLVKNDGSDKYYDEIGDCINYLVFVLRRKLDKDQALPEMTNEKFNDVSKKSEQKNIIFG